MLPVRMSVCLALAGADGCASASAFASASVRGATVVRCPRGRPAPISIDDSAGAVLTLTVTQAIAMPRLKSFAVFRPCASR
jgi:hypothetical protein